MNNSVEVDARGVLRLISDLNLTEAETRKAFRGGYLKAANIIQKQAKTNLKEVQTKSGTLKADELTRYVRKGIYLSGRGAYITALPSTRKQARRLAKKGIADKSFILRFFEGGTEERWAETKRRKGVVKGVIKTKNYRGRIDASHFFARAVMQRQKEAEGLVCKIIVERINQIVRERK